MYGSDQINQHNDKWPITSSLKLISSVLGTVILGAELSTVKSELVSLLNNAVVKFTRVGLTHTNDGKLYIIDLDRESRVDKTLSGKLKIDLNTFLCTYDITTGTTFMSGARDEIGTIQLVEQGVIVESNVREALGKLGLSSQSDSCCIS
jgi:hypothetical protein